MLVCLEIRKRNWLPMMRFWLGGREVDVGAGRREDGNLVIEKENHVFRRGVSQNPR